MSSIELNNVCLDYIVKTGTISIKKSMVHLCRGLIQKNHDATAIQHSSFRALNNINLSIGMGDRFGLLGRNGAGKSTLLRVLAKIFKPSAGTLRINGSVSSLFDVQLGMNPEATGFENIINLAIMRGFSRSKAKSIITEVEAFTELGTFLNNPVRTYSTGMQMKLAFAVSTAFPPEILLIDEIIGAGDMHFMQKATARLENMIENSHALVLTSHSNDIIRQLCNKIVVLERGEIQYIGNVDEGIAFYQSLLAS